MRYTVQLKFEETSTNESLSDHNYRKRYILHVLHVLAVPAAPTLSDAMSARQYHSRK